MTAYEYLKKIDKDDEIFNAADEYEYTEEQLIRFAELYHKRMVLLTRFSKECPDCFGEGGFENEMCSNCRGSGNIK